MSDTCVRIALVVEAEADRVTATAIADRLFIEHQLEPDDLREWILVLTWKDASRRRRDLGRRVHGHFDGVPGAPDALAARGALMQLHAESTDLDAVILMRDADQQYRERLQGLFQARAEHENHHRSPRIVVIGLAAPKRESWVLIGFMPRSSEEKQALEAEIQRLGFDPTQHPARLDASKHGADHDIKKCLRALEIDRERELICYHARPLQELLVRGRDTGFADFLEELTLRLLPLLTRIR